MKLSATYLELENILRDKTGKDIEIGYGGNAGMVLIKYMYVPCYVRIEKFDVPFVTLSYSIGSDSTNLNPGIMEDPCPPPIYFISGLLKRGAQALGNKAAGAFIENFVRHSSISINEDRILNVDLGKIPQLSKVLEVADIHTIVFNEEGVSINLLIKTRLSTKS